MQSLLFSVTVVCSKAPTLSMPHTLGSSLRGGGSHHHLRAALRHLRQRRRHFHYLSQADFLIAPRENHCELPVGEVPTGEKSDGELHLPALSIAQPASDQASPRAAMARIRAAPDKDADRVPRGTSSPSPSGTASSSSASAPRRRRATCDEMRHFCNQLLFVAREN